MIMTILMVMSMLMIDGDDNDDADNGLDDGASRCEGEHYLRPTPLNFAPLGSYNALEQKYRDIEIRLCNYLKYKFPPKLTGHFK